MYSLLSVRCGAIEMTAIIIIIVIIIDRWIIFLSDKTYWALKLLAYMLTHALCVETQTFSKAGVNQWILKREAFENS